MKINVQNIDQYQEITKKLSKAESAVEKLKNFSHREFIIKSTGWMDEIILTDEAIISSIIQNEIKKLEAKISTWQKKIELL